MKQMDDEALGSWMAPLLHGTLAGASQACPVVPSGRCGTSSPAVPGSSQVPLAWHREKVGPRGASGNLATAREREYEGVRREAGELLPET